MKRQALLAVIIVICAVLIAVSMRNLDKDVNNKASQVRLPKVDVLEAKASTITFAVESQGTVQASQQSRINAEINGLVKQTTEHLREGAFVKKDNILLMIEPTDYELAVARAQAELLTAQVELEDKQSRYEKNTLGIRQAQAHYDAAKKQLDKAQADLEKTRISVPFNGIIHNKQVDQGEFLANGQLISELYSSDQAEVRLPLTEKQVYLINPEPFNQTLQTDITLTLDTGQQTFTRKTQKARLEAIVDQQQRVFRLVATIDKPYQQPAFPIGSFIKASIAAQPVDNAFRIPARGLHQDNTVYLAKDGKLEARRVKVLYQRNNEVIITDGINNGDQVVLDRMSIMYDGMAIEVAQ